MPVEPASFQRPPLRRWRIKNFKSVGSAEIHFRPLTILVGANSSGKSTLIQSILALAQAAKKASRGGRFPLNGGFTTLGNFSEVRHQRAARHEHVEIGLEFSMPPAARRYRPRSQRPGRETITQFEMVLGGESQTLGSGNLQRVQLKHFSADRTPLLSVELAQEEVTSGPALERDPLGFVSVQGTASTIADDVIVVDESSPEISEVQIARAVLTAGIPTRIEQVGDLNQRLASRVVESVVRVTLTDIEKGLEQVDPSEQVGAAQLDPRLRELLGTRLRFSRDPAQHRMARIEAQHVLMDFLRSTGRELRSTAKTADTESTEELKTAFVERSIQDVNALKAELHAGEWENDLQGPPTRRVAPVDISTFLLLLDERVRLELELRICERLGPGEPVPSPPPQELQSRIGDVSGELLTFFSELIDWIGPIRQEPQVAYDPLSFTTYGAVGPKGEYTVAQLHDKGDLTRTLPVAPKAGSRPSVQDLGRSARMPIRKAVDKWLEYIGVGDHIHTKEIGRAGLELVIEQPGLKDPVPLGSVGFGVSQLLPVVTLCMLVPEGALLMFEQPELHLHPDSQQRLAEFFLAVSLSGRQVIVETHSEYLINRLRLLVAEDKSSRLSDLIGVLFVSKKDGFTTYDEFVIDEFGGLPDWPADFFDQSGRDARDLLRAAMEKKRRP